MELADIQHAIEALPVEQQTALFDLLAERDRLHWDHELEQDFSTGGRGMTLLQSVKKQAERGDSKPLDANRPGK